MIRNGIVKRDYVRGHSLDGLTRTTDSLLTSRQPFARKRKRIFQEERTASNLNVDAAKDI